MTPEELLAAVEARIASVSFQEELGKYNLEKHGARGWLGSEMGGGHDYYKALVLLPEILNAKRVCEIGTFTGASALALGKSCAESVVSYDVSFEAVTDEAIFTGKVSKVKLDNELSCLDIPFNDFDFIYIDIDHLGDKERLLHQKLLEVGYKGFVAWDDIYLTEGMKSFWSEIAQPKIETPYHPTGWGIVLYGAK